MATRFNVVTKRMYQSNGEEKAAWQNVGSLVHFPARDEKDEGFALELNMFPATKFYIFPQKEKTAPKSGGAADVDDITL